MCYYNKSNFNFMRNYRGDDIENNYNDDFVHMPNQPVFPYYQPYPEYQTYQGYDARRVNFNNIRRKNDFLKKSYPKIYFDLNNVIEDFLKNNFSLNNLKAEDDLEKFVNEIEEKFKSINNTNSSDDKENIKKDYLNNTQLLRDLIKIILITRLIKLNFDYLPDRNNNMYDYNYNPSFMGYNPRNYF